MRSIYLDSVLHIWNSTGDRERQMVMSQLAHKYGSHYTHEQFLDHLETIYRSRFFSYVLPSLPARRAIGYQA
jgi:hypothetical protein